MEWSTSAGAYQSEKWFVDSDGLWVVGREVFGRDGVFLEPWLLLKSPLGVGETWMARLRLNFDGKIGEKRLSIRAAQEEQVQTLAGSFRALRVDFTEPSITYVRWYARGIGIVREDTIGPGGRLLNSKVLKTGTCPPSLFLLTARGSLDTRLMAESCHIAGHQPSSETRGDASLERRADRATRARRGGFGRLR
jgi:hypothetical protein